MNRPHRKHPADRGPASRIPLLLWAVGLVAVVVAAIVGIAKFDDDRALGLAVVALLLAVVTLGFVVRDELADDDGETETSSRLGIRRPAAVVAVLAIVVVAFAFVGARHDDTAAVTAPATAAAVQTARDFVNAAVIDGGGEAACGYLTAAEQVRVGSLMGTPCGEAIDAANAVAPGAASTGHAVLDLPAAAAVASGRATVRLGAGAGAATFTLVPTTAAERDAFNPPAAAWRIASGATSILKGGTT